MSFINELFKFAKSNGVNLEAASDVVRDAMTDLFNKVSASAAQPKQAPAAAPAKKLAKDPNVDDPVEFPDYTATVSPTVNGSPNMNETKTISGVPLQVRFSPESKKHKVTLVCKDTSLLENAGITGRTNTPCKSVDLLDVKAPVKSTLKKIGMGLKDGTTQTRESAVIANGDLVLKYKNQSTKKGWSVLDIVNIKLLPDPVIEATKTVVATVVAAPVPKPVAPAVPGRPNLGRFSIVMPKSDPLFAGDSVLTALGFTSSMDITRNDHEDIRNRVAEALTHHQYPTLDWVNKNSEKFTTFDYRELISSKTIDLKTIVKERNNLLIKRKSVEEGTLADIVGLALVEDKGPSIGIICYGFISKENILKYIKIFPNCFMERFDSYKIDKKFLARIPFTW